VAAAVRHRRPHMGASSSAFTREELDIYEACTCLTSVEINKLQSKFTALCGASAKEVKMDSLAMEGGKVTPGVRAKIDDIVGQEEFANNPLARRLCKIFSSEPSGDLSFDEYVDLYNVLSPRASLEVKMQAAFRMYDLDDNGFLTTDDLAGMLQTIATPPPKGKKVYDCLLTDNEVQEVVNRVMRDCTRKTAPRLVTPRSIHGVAPPPSLPLSSFPLPHCGGTPC
jgi:hypothetical protein